jgi:hypothetical protein
MKVGHITLIIPTFSLEFAKQLSKELTSLPVKSTPQTKERLGSTIRQHNEGSI